MVCVFIYIDLNRCKFQWIKVQPLKIKVWNCSLNFGLIVFLFCNRPIVWFYKKKKTNLMFDQKN